MTRAPYATTLLVSMVLLAGSAASVAAAPRPQTSGGSPRILRMTERDALQNRWLKERFDTILPALMRREQIDMWIVICREHNEDPVYRTLVPQPSMFAWRLTMFVYTDRGAAGIEKLTINRYGGGDLHKDFPQFYRAAWEPESLDRGTAWRGSSASATRGASRSTNRRRSPSRTA
jgi:hypothetical protein